MAEGSNEVGRGGSREEPPTPAEMQELEEHIRSGDEVASARAEVELTRARLTETADTLQDKLEPENIKEQARSQAQEVARGLGYELMEAMRKNPVVSAVAGITLGLLIVRLVRR